MKVGILTYHNSINFGAVLQAYALQKAMRALGHDPSIIDYRRGANRMFYLKQAMAISPRIPMLLKSRTFSRFIRDHLPLTAPVRSADGLRAVEGGFDCLCVGSDQVWDASAGASLPAEFYFDWADPARTRLMSYAPSCGAMKPDAMPGAVEMGGLLRRFHHVSARDANTIECIRRAGGPEPDLVLDPTFLTGFDDLKADVETPAEPYALVYATPRIIGRSNIAAQVRGLGMPVVNAGFRAVPGGQDRIVIDPAQWLELYRRASVVVTSFFHGAIFAILFEKPFVVLSVPGKSNKVGDLLRRLALDGQELALDAPAGMLAQKISATRYEAARPLLAAEVERSKRYLSGALGAAQPQRGAPARAGAW